MVGFPAIGDVIGPYRVDAEIGRGGMGIVYRATQLTLDRPVALKILDPLLSSDAGFVARFSQEASILAGLDSPHIVQIHDHGNTGGQLYLAMQYVGGGDVSGLVARDGPLPPAEALQVFSQIVEALGDAHAHGIVHRDVKPSNVLLRADANEPFAYLCDFGIARAADAGLTRTGTVAGTWAFMSPETHTGAPATPRSDLYSAACVLWVMLTGRNPYGGTDVQVAMAHAQSPVPQLPGSDPLIVSLNRLLWTCLAKDPDDRPDTAADVLTLVRGPLTLAEGVAPLTITRPDSGIFRRPPIPPAATRPQEAKSPRPPARRLLAAGVAVLALAAGGTALALSGVLTPRAASAPGTMSGTPVASPPTGYRCWNGTPTADLSACTRPEGRTGLEYLYPSVEPASCTFLDYASNGAYECTIGNHGLIRYRFWYDPSEAERHYTKKYADALHSPMLIDGHRVGDVYRMTHRQEGVYKMSGVWLDGAFSFSVESPTRDERDALLRLVQVRAYDQLSGHPEGAAATGTLG